MDAPHFVFIDPLNKSPLVCDSDGNLVSDGDGQRRVYKPLHGCYDFVPEIAPKHSEREHYETHYQEQPVSDLQLVDIRSPWFDRCAPWYTALLHSLGNLRGKMVLLVGAGHSCREFYFAACGAHVVFTDISLEAVVRTKAEYESAQALLSEISAGLGDTAAVPGPGTIKFHAADANHLPFADGSFDIVYGCAFVHHLNDVPMFLSEARRVLKPEGICRFLDQADAPFWSLLKRTILRPFQRYSYWKHPRSPADIRANERGGFNFQSLLRQMHSGQFRRLHFDRQGFFLPIGWRHLGKALNWNKRAMIAARPFFYCLRLLDVATSWCHRISDNRLMLVWGFDR